MGTRRRGAERRQVSLAVEALEDRFLLSGAASPSAPATTNEPSTLFAAAHNSATKNETLSLPPQAALGQTSAWQIQVAAAKNTLTANYVPFIMNALVKPMMDHQLDADVDDDDPPGLTDGDALPNVALVFPLPCSACNNAAASFDFGLSSRSPAQVNVPGANLTPFLPLLSATGLGATKIAPHPPATAISENASGDPDPGPGREEMRPMPAVPQAPPSSDPPLVEEAAEPPPPSAGGPFAELLPIDMDAIQQVVDAFFQQLGDLSEEWRDGQVLEKLAPWFLAASLAGYGWVRLRDQRDRRLADLLDSDRPEAAPSIFLPGGEG